MNLVLTIAIGDYYQELAKVTHPTLKDYSAKIQADFLSLDNVDISNTTPHWEKFIIYDLLKAYDRIIYLDTDLVVRSFTPNLFDIVPIEQLGMWNEAQCLHRPRHLLVTEALKYGIDISGCDHKFYNSGVMVISKEHQEVFKKPTVELGDINSYYEQMYINIMIKKLNINMFDLSYHCNRIDYIDTLVANKEESYIIHKAGCEKSQATIDALKAEIK